MKIPPLVAVDLDGTLLNNDHGLSSLTKQVISRAEGAGILVIISTGRSYKGMMHYKDELGLKNPVICYNGAMIVDGAKDKILHQWPLPHNLTKSAVDYARERGFHLQIFQNERLLYEREGEESEFYQGSTGLRGEVVNFDELETLECAKALMVRPPSRHSAAFPELLEARQHFHRLYEDALFCVQSRPFYLEFMNGEASKGKALDFVCRELGIAPEDCAAFGDAFNDLEMLEKAGISVAMANAPEELKSSCCCVTEYSNDQDGVARFIQKHFL